MEEMLGMTSEDRENAVDGVLFKADDAVSVELHLHVADNPFLELVLNPGGTFISLDLLQLVVSYILVIMIMCMV